MAAQMAKSSSPTWVAFVAMAAACSHAKIPNTTIDDTPEHREVIALVEEYKKSVEALDAPAVLALVSPDYFEDNGNTDTADDYDYDGLRDSLETSFGRTRAMQLILRIDHVEVEQDTAFADLQYEYRAHNEYPSGMRWDTGSDRTRLSLRRDGFGQWRIISGL